MTGLKLITPYNDIALLELNYCLLFILFNNYFLYNSRAGWPVMSMTTRRDANFLFIFMLSIPYDIPRPAIVRLVCAIYSPLEAIIKDELDGKLTILKRIRDDATHF